MPTGPPGFLSQALVLAYVAVSLGVFGALAARGAASNQRRAAAAVLAAGAVAAGVAAVVEGRLWLIRSATDWGLREPGGHWLGSMPAEGYMRDYVALVYVALSACAFALLFVRAHRGREVSRVRLLAGNALFLAALGLLALVSAETHLRFFLDRSDSIGPSLTQRAWEIRHWRVNGYGFRDREWKPEKSPGVRRVLFLGDSIIGGYGVDRAEDRVSGVVARELEQRSPGSFDVWTAGVPLWSTGDQVDWLRRALPGNRIDRVVLGFCLNDAADLVPPGEFGELYEAMSRPFWVDPGQSFVFDGAWWLMASNRHAEGWRRIYEHQRQALRGGPEWRQQFARMRALSDSCRANGARLDVVLFPDALTWSDEYPFDDVHERVAAGWRELGARVVDLRGAWRGISGKELVAGPFDAHPNERGHALAAEAVLAELFETP